MTPQERLQILTETVRTFGNREWFRDAVVYDKHPVSGDPTLEIKVNYVPRIGPDRKLVMDFALGYNLSERFTTVDRNGNPVE